MTFEQLDLLLRQVSEGMDGSSDWPPPQEKECMVVATLNLLRLQVGSRLFSEVLLDRCLGPLIFDTAVCHSSRRTFKKSRLLLLSVLSSTQPSVTRWIQRS